MEKKRMKTTFLLVLIACAAALISACTTTSKTTMGPSIESSFMDSYAYKTYLQNDAITIQSDNGKITLTGTVPEESHKILAEKTMKSIANVEKVDNKLQVEGGSPAQGSDAWMGAEVKAELMSHPDVNATKTDVYVKDKVVTLKGQTDSVAQKSLMTEYVKNVKGIKNVVNQLTVASAATAPPTMGQAESDASITSQAAVALEANPSTSDINAIINTSGGMVTVQGYADNQAEKDLVTQIIADIQGVKAVDNQMIVEQPAVYTK